MSAKLAPCPFCGNECPSVGLAGLWWLIGCGGCGFQSKDYACKENAIAAWNRRDGQDPARVKAKLDLFPKMIEAMELALSEGIYAWRPFLADALSEARALEGK